MSSQSFKQLKSLTGALVFTVAMTLAATASAASRYTIQAECSGLYDVLVVDWTGYGPALYIYQNGSLLKAAWATKSIDDSFGVETTSYATGEVIRGGASLRIRTRDDRIPQNAGSAHLTYANGNPILSCSTY